MGPSSMRIAARRRVIFWRHRSLRDERRTKCRGNNVKEAACFQKRQSKRREEICRLFGCARLRPADVGAALWHRRRRPAVLISAIGGPGTGAAKWRVGAQLVVERQRSAIQSAIFSKNCKLYHQGTGEGMYGVAIAVLGRQAAGVIIWCGGRRKSINRALRALHRLAI